VRVPSLHPRVTQKTLRKPGGIFGVLSGALGRKVWFDRSRPLERLSLPLNEIVEHSLQASPRTFSRSSGISPRRMSDLPIDNPDKKDKELACMQPELHSLASFRLRNLLKPCGGRNPGDTAFTTDQERVGTPGNHVLGRTQLLQVPTSS
jgi:hypothetical protein